MQFKSPRAISIIISLLVTLVSTIIVSVTLWYAGLKFNIFYFIGLFAVVLATIFYITIYAIEKFIYDRIKLLYRSAQIFRSKKALEEMNLDMRTDVLGEVSKEVAKWMLEQHITIDQLEERETFRREFMGNLSHELKTPVFSVQGYILTLLEGGLEDKDINIRFLKKAANGVERITSLLNDLDAITKLESGEVNIEKRRFDFVKLAKQVVEELESKAQKRKIIITVRNPSEKPVWVFADPVKINQVLTNLIINAINYGNKGGFIIISNHPIDNKILIEVEDNGIGITEEDTLRIFERFYRVEKSRARKKGGTGLGLAIVKHILDSHNETVSVRSSPGEGSVFSFSLRRAK
jgi:two-component system phosphate regulon sensor histidine kinase PhoR